MLGIKYTSGIILGNRDLPTKPARHPHLQALNVTRAPQAPVAHRRARIPAGPHSINKVAGGGPHGLFLRDLARL